MRLWLTPADFRVLTKADTIDHDAKFPVGIPVMEQTDSISARRWNSDAQLGWGVGGKSNFLPAERLALGEQDVVILKKILVISWINLGG